MRIYTVKYSDRSGFRRHTAYRGNSKITAGKVMQRLMMTSARDVYGTINDVPVKNIYL